jgi:hypothetical protein
MRPPKSPIHPGEILLREFLDPAGVTQAAFATRIGWTRARLNELVRGKRGVTRSPPRRSGRTTSMLSRWRETAWLCLMGFAIAPAVRAAAPVPAIPANEVRRMTHLPALLLSAALAAPVQATEPAVQPDRTIRLFDGRDLSRFYAWLVDTHGADPDRVFSVVDEVDGSPAIRISGERWGGLVTRESYRNFRLVVEFRWGLATWGNRRRAARDSGILIHCQGPDGNTRADMNGPWMRSVEAQIIEGGVGDFILVAGFAPDGRRLEPRVAATAGRDRDGEAIYDPAAERQVFESGRINWRGRDVDWKDMLGFRGRQDVESPFGEWTRLEVVADGDKVTNIVNGTVVNEASASSLTEGRILIQSEGAEIYFRRIDLEPLVERAK